MGFLDKSGVAKLWKKISDTFSRQDHTHGYTPEGIVDVEIQESENGNYTPSGVISDLEFTGGQSTITTAGDIEGEVSTPEFTGDSIDIEAEFEGTSESVNINFIAEGEVSTPEITVNSESEEFITGISIDVPEVDNKISLSHVYDVDKKHVNILFSNDLTILPPSVNIVKSNAITTVSAVSSKPEFTGTPAVASATVVPKGKITVNPIVPTGIISKPEFSGTATLTGTFTPTGTISKATFTGKPVAISTTFTGTKKSTDSPKNVIKS